MTLHIEEENEAALDLDVRSVAQTVIDECIEYEHCPYETEINLLLTDNNGIHEINLEYRKIDSPTDVLSFPMVDYDVPSDFTIAESNEAEYFNPESGELLLGDIIISTEKVVEQAEKFGHSIKREFAFLIAHSMLHLFGYDHMESGDAEVMEEKQNAILNNLNIMR